MKAAPKWRPVFDDRRLEIIDKLRRRMDASRNSESGEVSLLEWDRHHSRWRAALDSYSLDESVAELLARVRAIEC